MMRTASGRNPSRDHKGSWRCGVLQRPTRSGDANANRGTGLSPSTLNQARTSSNQLGFRHRGSEELFGGTGTRHRDGHAKAPCVFPQSTQFTTTRSGEAAVVRSPDGYTSWVSSQKRSRVVVITSSVGQGTVGQRGGGEVFAAPKGAFHASIARGAWINRGSYRGWRASWSLRDDSGVRSAWVLRPANSVFGTFISTRGALRRDRYKAPRRTRESTLRFSAVNTHNTHTTLALLRPRAERRGGCCSRADLGGGSADRPPQATA